MWDDCCDQVGGVTQVCSRRDLSTHCQDPENLGHEVDGFVDWVGDAIDLIANPLDDIVTFGPDFHLDVTTCAAACIFGFSSAKNNLGLEFRVEIDVESSDVGTFKIFMNDVEWLSEVIGGDSTCLSIPGLHIPGLVGLQLCLNLDPHQEDYFLFSTNGVEMEVHLRVEVLGFDFDTPWGSTYFEWPCPNLQAIISVIVVVVLLVCIAAARKCSRRNAAASKAVVSVSGGVSDTPSLRTVSAAATTIELHPMVDAQIEDPSTTHAKVHDKV